MRDYKSFIAAYKCKKCGRIIQEFHYAPTMLYNKPIDINEMYNCIDSRVPKIKIGNCCMPKGKTVQELIFISEDEEKENEI